MPGPGVLHVRWRDRPARWLATRSLRGQLITGLVALLALACAGVGLVSYIVISHTLLNQLDYQLQAAGGRYTSCIEEKHHEGPLPPKGAAPTDCNKTPGLNAGTFGARVKDGEVTDQGIIDGQSHLSAADQATLTRLLPTAGTTPWTSSPSTVNTGSPPSRGWMVTCSSRDSRCPPWKPRCTR